MMAGNLCNMAVMPDRHGHTMHAGLSKKNKNGIKEQVSNVSKYKLI